MQSPSLASVALLALVVAVVVSALTGKSDIDREQRPYIPQMVWQTR
jgi:hypothetical protein